MHRPFLIGSQLYLRRVEDSDLNDTYLGWLNDPVVTRYLETGKFPTTLGSLRAFWDNFQKSPTDLLFAIVLPAADGGPKADRHIGNVTLNHVNWIHRTADTGLMIGEKDCWGKGYAYQAWRLLIDYAFIRLGLRKIIAGAVIDNGASLATLKKLGFQVEGTFRKEYLVEGRLRDGLRLGVFEDEFRSATTQTRGES